MANEVQNLRLQKGITQEELARAVGVSRQTVIAIEGGNYTPSVLLAIKIAQFFKTSVEKIFKIAYDKKRS
ncbi:MAG: helix-turn-helix transcriptional regulator [Candidatus Sungbacteria bacterium]|uniref:Helix-turn-helix transcriptional regulator n=1 Tax=Candidatus Sungiibacteriota bacterium TaxID=2750080 RepID=A0A9D6QS25_9BACT|nr:helix-turn-helix transcriptional regulator [Candidatus Sungbacteria bacterium]